MKKEIKITSKFGADFDTKISIGKDKYLVQTEDGGPEHPLITTRIYLEGRVLLTRNIDYSDIVNAPDKDEKVLDLMRKQQKSVIRILKTEETKKTRTTADYLMEVKNYLQIKNKKSALRVLNEALERHPDDPFLLSYYGCLEAVVNRNYKFGIDTCLDAIDILKRKVPFGEDFFYPVFYLNLGRAYLAAGKKNEALKAYNKGIQIDSENKDLLWEIRKLGVRKKPAISFLKRSNPINKYIGMLIHAAKK